MLRQPWAAKPLAWTPADLPGLAVWRVVGPLGVYDGLTGELVQPWPTSQISGVWATDTLPDDADVPHVVTG